MDAEAVVNAVRCGLVAEGYLAFLATLDEQLVPQVQANRTSPATLTSSDGETLLVFVEPMAGDDAERTARRPAGPERYRVIHRHEESAHNFRLTIAREAASLLAVPPTVVAPEGEPGCGVAAPGASRIAGILLGGRYRVADCVLKDRAVVGYKAYDVQHEKEVVLTRREDLGPRYLVLGEAGSGGMATVVKAYDAEIDRLVAIKFLHETMRTQEMIARFHGEARAAARVQHPNVASIFDVGHTTGGAPYYTQPFIEGDALTAVVDAYLKDDGRFKGEDERNAAVDLFRAVVRGVEAAHEAGIVHRDLKPANIMVEVMLGKELMLGPEDIAIRTTLKRRTDSREVPHDHGRHVVKFTPHVTDFGLARDVSQEVRLSLPGSVFGTPMYMPPEQARGQVDEVDVRSDVYSLGVVLYETLTGRLPFDGTSLFEVLEKVKSQEPVRPRRLDASIPADLEAIVVKAMEKDKARRYASAREFEQDLAACRQGFPVKARRITWGYRARRWIGRHRAWTAALMVLGIVALVGGDATHRYQQRDREQREARERERRAIEEQLERERAAERGRWGNPVYTSPPGWTNAAEQWRVCTYDRLNERFVDGNVELQEGELRLAGDDNVFATFNAPVYGNVRIEFEGYVVGNGGNLNCFLCGAQNDLGYSGYLFQLGASGNTYSMIFRGGTREVERTDDFQLDPGRLYAVAAEIEDNHLILEVNGRSILEYEDTLALTSRTRALVGFQTYSSDIRIRSVRVFRQVPPLKRRTILQADDYLRSQNFDLALFIYEQLAAAYARGGPQTPEEARLGEEAEFKMAQTRLAQATQLSQEQNRSNESQALRLAALAGFQRFARSQPWSYYAPFALFETAQMTFSDGKCREALEILDRLEASYPESAVARVHVRGFYREAQLHLFENQKFGEDEYVAYLKRYLRYKWGIGGEAGGYYRLGLACLYLGRFPEAREALLRVLRDYPWQRWKGQARVVERTMIENNGYVLMGLARLYRDADGIDGLTDTQRFERSLDYFREALSLSCQDSNKIIYSIGISDVLVFLGRKEEALRSYEATICDYGAANRQMAAETQLRMGDLLRSMRRYPEAEQTYADVARFEDPQRTAWGLIRQADLLDSLGRTPDAQAAFREVVTKYSDRPLQLAIAKFRLGEMDWDSLRRAIDTTPRTFKEQYFGFLYAARRRVMDGDMRFARELYEEALNRARLRDRSPDYLAMQEELAALCRK